MTQKKLAPAAPKRCNSTGKVIYDFEFDAKQAAAERSRCAGIPLTVYRATECEHWHLTKNVESW